MKIGRIQGSALLSPRRFFLKTIDGLLTPRIESENVTYSALIEPKDEVVLVLGNENRVEITEEGITITGKGKDELDLGQSYLRQLKLIFDARLPICSFSFYSPSYRYRGFHIDCVRHFVSVEELKRLIDAMSLVGYNYFHWHLTDDQGWRFAVPGYDRLETISSTRYIYDNNDQKHVHKGFYSREDLEAIEEFSKERGITVIPEMETPGHAEALLSAYPEFGCTGKEIPVQNNWGVFENVMNPSSPELWVFLEKAIAELASVFHGPFIHIGGDECPHKQWEGHQGCRKIMEEYGLKDTNELQGWFTSKASGIVKKYGKRAMGWDEVVDAPSIDKDVVVMSWRGLDGARKATARGHNVVLCPENGGCYMDRYQSHDPWELGNLSYSLPKESYDLDISMKELGEKERSLILGAQCCVWGEKLHSGREMEYMLFPRVFILGENLWLGDRKNWEKMKDRRKVLSDITWKLNLVSCPGSWD